jgi:hypothetical protein
MPDIQAPTGEEDVQKYYGGAYLDEIDSLNAVLRNAAATGNTDVDLSAYHPLTIQAVAPHLLTDEQKEVVANNVREDYGVSGQADKITHEGNLNEGKSYEEANNNPKAESDNREAQVESQKQDFAEKSGQSEDHAAVSQSDDAEHKGSTEHVEVKNVKLD